MKVDRRSFLGLGLGAAAGMAVSPSTWKLMDDSSIWTQNWPWTPVPKDGEVTFDNTVCSLCSGNCGITIRKINGRPVKIEGRDGYPVNDGGICLHGISGLQYVYDPSRVKSPLMKKKGNTWEKISWENAIDFVAQKITKIRNNNKADKIACITDKKQGTISGIFERLLKTIGSNNFFAMESMEHTWMTTLEKIHGINALPDFDLKNSDFILSFGCGFIEGWGSPVNNFRINSLRREKGTQFVQIEPRLSNTAANADMWVPIKPGTEAELALGIANIIITENLYNKAYISKFSKNFDNFAEMVKEKYFIEKVVQATGIPELKIRKIANDFANASFPIAIAGKGRGETAGSFREITAVHMLNCLIGNINKDGGVGTSTPIVYDKWQSVEMDEIALKGVEKSLINQSVSSLFENINLSSKSPLEALFIYNANPCFSMRNTKAIHKAMEKIPFVVSFSSYMDETTKHADIILPSHIFLERYEDIIGSSGRTKSIIGLSKPLIKPAFDTKNPGDSILMLANALKGSIAASFPWENYKECLKNITQDVWDDLSNQGYIILEKNSSDFISFSDFSVISKDMKKIEAQGDGDLILVPVNNIRLINNSFESSPFAIKTVSDKVLKDNDTFVEINPLTAYKIGLSQGDYAMLKTLNGSFKVKVTLFEGIMPGIIGMAQGLGHIGENKYKNKYVHGKGLNINELMSPVQDTISGMDAAWGIRANIVKV